MENENSIKKFVKEKIAKMFSEMEGDEKTISTLSSLIDPHKIS